MNSAIRLKDWKALSAPSGPLFAMAVPWMLVLGLHSLSLIGLIVPGISPFHGLVIANIFSIVVLCFILQTFFPQSLSLESEFFKLKKEWKGAIYLLLSFYLMAQMIQAIAFGGFPLMHLLGEGEITYVDYGYKSLNGLLNAIYLSATTAFFFYLFGRENLAKKMCSLPFVLFSIFADF